MPHRVDFDDVFETLIVPLECDAITDEAETWSTLEVASADGDLETVLEIIQSKHLTPTGYFAASAIVAIENGNSDVVTALLDAGLPVDENLVRAALNSPYQQQYLRLFVASGWDVNANLTSHTPSVLSLAAEAGNLRLVQWLVQDLNADVNIECDQLHTPLSVALQHSSEAIVNFMMEQRINADKGQLMHYAIWRALRQAKWETRLMDVLLEKGAPINRKMYECKEESEVVHQMQAIPFGTPLHIAVEAESAVAVNYLLRHGAKVDVPNEEDKTPLQLATGVIRELLLA